MDVAIGAAGLGAVMGWQLPMVRGTSWSTALASTAEVALTGIPVFVVFGPVTAGVVVAAIMTAGVVHAAFRASLATRRAEREGRETS
jgi:hypothetical protein